MKKRLGTFISALLFCLLCLPGVCLAAEFTAGNLKYNTTGDDTVEVVGMVNPLPEPGELVIPAKVTYDSKEYTVTAIGESAFRGENLFGKPENYLQGKSIKSVKLPDSITQIGQYAFKECSNIEGEFKLPPNLTTLGSYAFYGCEKMESIEIPASMQTIYQSTFEKCTSLTTVILHEGLINIGNPTSGYGDVFAKCSSLTKIDLPSTLQFIGSCAFDTTGLTKIEIPDSVTTIKYQAFNSCSSLAEVKLPSNLQTIEDNTFSSCPQLLELELPASLTKISPYAFQYSSTKLNAPNLAIYALTSGLSNFNGSVELTGSPGADYEFDDGDYHYIVIDEENNLVQLSGFSSSYGSDKPSGDLTIPATANALGRNYTVTAIGKNVFKDCVDVTNFELPESLTAIGDSAFYGCTGLTEITLPDSVTSIGNSSFNSCKNLTAIEWPTELRSIGTYAFNQAPLTSAILPDKLESIGDFAFFYGSIEGSKLRELSLPDSLKSIGKQAFYECGSLESVKLPANLTSLGNAVFFECVNLQTVEITANSSLTELPFGTFAGCVKLENIELPASIKTIGHDAFSTCTSLQTVKLPENLEVLEQGAFFNCPALSGTIQLPESVTSIGKSAFKGCTGLERIYIPGSNLQNVSDEAFAGVPLVTCDNEEMLAWLTDRAGDDTKIRLQNYPISVSSEPAEGGSATASASIAAIGQQITLTATPNEGWLFEKWQPENPELVITDNSFTMPDYAVNILAIFKKIVKPKPEEPTPEEPTPPGPPQPSVYTITFDTDGGVLAQGTPNPDSATSGQEYKMPAANKSGHTLKHWAIGGKTSNITANPGDVYTFTADTWVYAIWQPDNTNQPSGGGGGRRPSQTKPTETIKPTEPTQPGKPNTGNADNISSIFQDLQPGAWYSEAVAYVYALGLMQGVAEGEFAPNANLSRAMLAQIIYNMAGQPETSANSSFADVADNVWYSKAISWANAQGVVTGYSAAEFAPNAEITREQMIVMLWRYAGQPTTSWQQADFPDWPQSSAYARQAICWAAECGLIKGHSDGTLRPQATATRAEAAQVLQNYLTKISK